MKIYTKTGDNGTTSLVGGTRVPKNSARLEAYGTIDELNSWIGLIAAQTSNNPDIQTTLTDIQHRLFDIGTALATEPQSKWQPKPFDDNHTKNIEKQIDNIEQQLPKHNQFILPGGTAASAITQITRTIARRAERRILDIPQQNYTQILKYINRLSDYLFVLARQLNHTNNTPETYWQQNI